MGRERQGVREASRGRHDHSSEVLHLRQGYWEQVGPLPGPAGSRIRGKVRDLMSPCRGARARAGSCRRRKRSVASLLRDTAATRAPHRLPRNEGRGRAFGRRLTVVSLPLLRDALNALSLNRYCCRRMLMTHVDLIEKLLTYNTLEKVTPQEFEKIQQERDQQQEF